MYLIVILSQEMKFTTYKLVMLTNSSLITVKNNYGKSTLKYKGAKMYNELPNDIIMYCKSLNIFKNRTKKYYKSFY